MSRDEKWEREKSEARVAAELGEILTAPIVPGGARWPIVTGQLPGPQWYDPCAVCSDPYGRRVGVGAEPLCDRCTKWHDREVLFARARFLMSGPGGNSIIVNITA